MFVIVVYDINAKRVAEFHKICRKYLYPIQRSVFEGNMSQKTLKQLQCELEHHMDYKQDFVCIYELDTNKKAYKVQLGAVEEESYIL